MTMMATTSRPITSTQEYSLPSKLESQAWFSHSGASHNLTPYDFHLQNIKSYVGSNKVYVGNDQTLTIKSVGVYLEKW